MNTSQLVASAILAATALPSLANAAGLANQGEKRGLKSILGVVVMMEHSPADVENEGPVPPDQHLERRLVPACDEAIEQLRI